MAKELGVNGKITRLLDQIGKLMDTQGMHFGYDKKLRTEASGERGLMSKSISSIDSGVLYSTIQKPNVLTDQQSQFLAINEDSINCE